MGVVYGVIDRLKKNSPLTPNGSYTSNVDWHFFVPRRANQAGQAASWREDKDQLLLPFYC